MPRIPAAPGGWASAWYKRAGVAISGGDDCGQLADDRGLLLAVRRASFGQDLGTDTHV
jgi:hypothetical protein